MKRKTKAQIAEENAKFLKEALSRTYTTYAYGVNPTWCDDLLKMCEDMNGMRIRGTGFTWHFCFPSKKEADEYVEAVLNSIIPLHGKPGKVSKIDWSKCDELYVEDYMQGVRRVK